MWLRCFCHLQPQEETCVCPDAGPQSSSTLKRPTSNVYLVQVRYSLQRLINHCKLCLPSGALQNEARKSLIRRHGQVPLALQSQRLASITSSRAFYLRLRSDPETAALLFLSGHPRVRGRSVDHPRRCADVCLCRFKLFSRLTYLRV